jgi:quercetin dioxygenase-like cupin family protein
VSAFEDLADLQPQELGPGYLARPIHGEQLTLAVVEVAPNAQLPAHAHANEQFGVIIRGSLTLRIGDEERTVGPGQPWRIPGNVPHSVVAGPDGAIVCDVFSPPRTDWQDAEKLEPRPPIWP